MIRVSSYCRYFCLSSDTCGGCLACCCRNPEFIEEECKELSVIDNLKVRAEKDDEYAEQGMSLLPDPIIRNKAQNGDMSK